MQLKKGQEHVMPNGDKIVGVSANERKKTHKGNTITQVKNKWGRWVSKAKSLAGKKAYKSKDHPLKDYKDMRFSK